MKKIFKSRIFCFLLGVVLSCGITTALAFAYLAPDVGFTPKDDKWEVDDVKEALDSLHGSIWDMGSFETTIYNQNLGQLTAKNTSITLNKGNYIILATADLGYNTTTESNGVYANSGSFSFEYDSSKCNFTDMSSKHYRSLASTRFNNMYSISRFENFLYFVEVKEDNVSIKFKYAGGTDTNIALGLTLSATKFRQ